MKSDLILPCNRMDRETICFLDVRCPEILQLVDSYRAFEGALRAITERVCVCVYVYELFLKINFIFN